MSPALVAVAISVAFGVLIATLAVVLGQRSQQNRLEQLRALLGGESLRRVQLNGYRRTFPGFDVVVDGRKVTLGVMVRNKLTLCVVQLQASAMPLIVFRRERAVDRLGRALRLNREVQSGADEFDRAVYIESDEEEPIVRRVVEEPKLRDAVLDSIRHHRAIILSREGVGGMVLFARNLEATAASVKSAVGALARVVAVLPLSPGGTGVRQRARGDLLAIAAILLIPLVYVQIAVLANVKPDGYEPYLRADSKAAARVVLIAFAALLLLGFLWIRGHSRSLRNFGMLIFTSLFLFLGAMQEVCVANALLDKSPAVPQYTTVISKQRRSHRRSADSYHVKFQSWLTPGVTGDLRINRALWQDLQPGDRLEVATRAGAFHWMWIESLKKTQ
jgi:hypothetical protein